VGEVNPTKADTGRRTPSYAVELLGELDAGSDRDAARQAAIRLKEQIAQSSLDFSACHQHVVVDRDVEQTILVHNTAGRTQMGWLHGAMLSRQPFTLSVFVHGLERRRERQRLKLAYRRLHTINRGAEQRGRVPDFDRYVQEREYQELLGELATGETSNLFRVSIYQTLRSEHPARSQTSRHWPRPSKLARSRSMTMNSGSPAANRVRRIPASSRHARHSREPSATLSFQTF